MDPNENDSPRARAQAVCTCGRKLSPLFLGEAATFVVQRTCRKCGAKWQIKVSPMKTATSGWVHRLDLLCLEGAR
jgi:hypothetical protein